MTRLQLKYDHHFSYYTATSPTTADLPVHFYLYPTCRRHGQLKRKNNFTLQSLSPIPSSRTTTHDAEPPCRTTDADSATTNLWFSNMLFLNIFSHRTLHSSRRKNIFVDFRSLTNNCFELLFQKYVREMLQKRKKPSKINQLYVYKYKMQ